MKGKLVVLLLLLGSVAIAQNNGATNGTSNYSLDVPAVASSYTRSLTFDQTNYVVPASPISFGTPGQAVSMGIRFKMNSWGSNGSRILLSSSAQANSYILVENSGITIQTDEPGASKFFPASLSLNTWYSLVITREASYVWFYLYNTNGTLLSSLLSGYMLFGQTTFDRVGRYHTGVGTYAPFNLDGKLSDLRFWNSRLSDADANAYGANATASAQHYFHWKMNEGTGTTVYDSQSGGDTDDAQAFITAAEITDNAQKNAIIQLVSDLKSAGIWTKMKAIYPFVGGDAVKHSFNLRNPALYQLTFNGTWVHSANGSDPDGSTAYAATGLVPSTALTLNNTHLSYYSREDMDVAAIEMGCVNDGIFSLGIYNDVLYSDQYHYSTGRLTVANANSVGLFVGSRTSSSSHAVYKDGVSLANSTSSGGTLPNIQILLGARNENGTPYYHTNRQCAFSSIGDGLSPTEVTALGQAVQAYLANLTSTPTPPISSSQWIISANNIYNANAGSVGIGTGALHMGDANYKLFVAKGIRTEKLKVDVPFSSWPDYVFDKNYKLLSLEETAKFIKLNKHLPGIPSAKEVGKTGIDVGANQALLLQKIEELTLLLIEQNKINEQQTKQIQKLSAQIKRRK